MEFIVRTTHQGQPFFLRSTIWTRELERATKFTTQEEAQAGIEKARKFNKAATMKAARIEQLA